MSELAEETDGEPFTAQPLSSPQKHYEVFRAKLADLAGENVALRRALVQRILLAEEESALMAD